MLIDDLKRLLGEEAAKTLISTYGGRRIWIPTVKFGKRPSKLRGALTDLLGASKAASLFLAYGDQYMDVPADRRTDPADAYHKIAEMHRNGATVKEMAEAVGRSRRTIFRWLNMPASKLKA